MRENKLSENILMNTGAVDKTSDRAQSLFKGLFVLQSFSSSTASKTLSEVARAVDMNRATTRRFLLTLVDLGYLETDGKRYSLTPKVMTLGYNYLSSLPWWQIANPLAEEVSRNLSESCSIGVLTGDQLIFVARAQGPRALAINLTPGRVVPVHAAAIGRVLLAEMEASDVDAFVERNPLIPLTPYTVTDTDALKASLRQVKQDGYAVVNQELEIGLLAVAVPLRDKYGRVIAAIGVSTQAQRRTMAEIENEVLPTIQKAAAKLRARL